MAKLQKIVDYTRCYESKNGRLCPSISYYHVVEREQGIPVKVLIKPVFSKDYQKLDILADVVIVNGDKDNPKKYEPNPKEACKEVF